MQSVIIAPFCSHQTLSATSHPIYATFVRQVLVLGENFRHSSRLACQFGSFGVDPRLTVPATFLNTSALLCISPARLTPPTHPISAAVAVEVTNNAAVGGSAAAWSTFSRSGVAFQYEASPEIEKVVPHLGPVSGNFSVRVAGGPFPDTTELRYNGNEITVVVPSFSIRNLSSLRWRPGQPGLLLLSWPCHALNCTTTRIHHTCSWRRNPIKKCGVLKNIVKHVNEKKVALPNSNVSTVFMPPTMTLQVSLRRSSRGGEQVVPVGDTVLCPAARGRDLRPGAFVKQSGLHQTQVPLLVL